MIGVLTGFAIILVVIATGYILEWTGVAGPGAQRALNRVAFFVASPCLLFTVISRAELKVLFSAVLLNGLLAFAAVALIGFLVTNFVFKKDFTSTMLTAWSAGYTNCNNIGLPVAAYVIGDTQYVAPTLLLQLTVLSPVLLAVLDASSRGHVSVRTIALSPVRNPIVIASLLGVIVAAIGLHLPDIVLKPISMLGDAAVPLVLLSFGMSLRGRKILEDRSETGPIVTAVILKTVAMPLVAFLLAEFAFHMTPQAVFACTVIAALPTAQNIFKFAQRYELGVTIARDVVLITTFVSLVVIFGIATVLHPALST